MAQEEIYPEDKNGSKEPCKRNKVIELIHPRGKMMNAYADLASWEKATLIELWKHKKEAFSNTAYGY